MDGRDWAPVRSQARPRLKTLAILEVTVQGEVDEEVAKLAKQATYM